MDKLFGLDTVVAPPKGTLEPVAEATRASDAPAASLKEKAAYLWRNWRSFAGAADTGSPGPVEFLHKEARGDRLLRVFLNNLLFDGAKIDVTRALNNNFLFTHSLAFASQAVPPNYSFVTAFMNGQSFVNANIDTDANLSARVHLQSSERLLTKIQTSVSKSAVMNMLNVEADYIGEGFSASLKAMNPNPLERATGQYALGYLQNVTPALSLGAEFAFNRLSRSFEDVSVQYFGKYLSARKGDALTVTYAPATGALMSSYWRRLSPKMEVAADLQLSGAQGKLDAVAQVATKLEYQSGSSLRMQVDSTGKIMSILEERISPNIAVQFAAELDHTKAAHKVGLGLNFES